jgi:hypothetical protein
MTCLRCTTPTRPYATFGNNQCRKCGVCGTFTYGPRGGTAMTAIPSPLTRSGGPPRRPRRPSLLWWWNRTSLTTHAVLLVSLIVGAPLATPVLVALLSACLLGDCFLMHALARRRRGGR